MGIENADTRYFVEIDIESKKVIRWDLGDRLKLFKEKLPENIVRIYISRGQFNKLTVDK